MKLSVLVVSDDETIRINLLQDINSLSHAAVAVSSVDLAQLADDFDLILLDGTLLETAPEIIAECEKHRSLYAQIVVITLPSHLDNVSRWLERGANDWLLYPCQPLVLKTKFDQHVRLRLTAQIPELIAVFASDARSPLTSISATAFLLQEKTGDSAEQQQQLFSILTRSAEKQFVLLQNFIDYVNVIYYPEGISRTSITSIGSEIVSIMEDIQKYKKIKFGAQIVPIPDDLPSVQIARHNLYAILVRLLENISVWASEGSEILLRASLQSSIELPKVQFTLQYTGIAIDMKYKDKIFEPWSTLPFLTYKRSLEHSLEFSIVKAQIETLGGEIWVESTPNGSAFHFTLPVAELQ